MGKVDMKRRAWLELFQRILFLTLTEERQGMKELEGQLELFFPQSQEKKGFTRATAWQGKEHSHKEADIMKKSSILSVDAKNQRGGWRTEKIKPEKHNRCSMWSQLLIGLQDSQPKLRGHIISRGSNA
jgi:hypothetical protein